MSLRVALLASRCLPWHDPGGLERHVHHLARHLRRRGIEVDLFISTPEHPADPFAGDSGFRLEIVPGRAFLRRRFTVVLSRSTTYLLFSLRMGRAVAKAAATRGYAAVIAQGATAFGYAVAAARQGLRTPIVLNPQGMEEAVTPNALKRALYLPMRAAIRYAAARSAAVVATDEVLVDAVRRVLDVPPERIVVLPNAVDVQECRALATEVGKAEALETAGATDARPLLVTVGRLAPNKGFAVALDALARVRGALPAGWLWAIVGDGPMRPALESRADALGLSTNVRFLGGLDDRHMHNLVASADLFLNPTLYEGSSLVTLEAMAHGVPIVATSAGGIPDKIREGETGWVAPPGNAEALAAALRRWLAATRGEQRRRGEAARRLCETRFDWSVAAERWERTIRDLSGL